MLLQSVELPNAKRDAAQAIQLWRKPKLKIHVCSMNYPMLWKNVPGLLYSKKWGNGALK